MLIRALRQLLLLAFSAAAFWTIPAASAVEISTGSCRPRGAVDLAERQPYEQAALDFASLVVSGEFAQAHARMTRELKGYVPLDKFLASAQPNIEPFKRLGRLHIAHSYLVETGVMTGNGQFVICAAEANASMSSPQGRVFVLAKPIPKQAHVIIEGNNQEGTWTFSLWMIPIQGSWQVMGFHASPPPAIDESPSNLWTLATLQQHKGHDLNAYLLFGVISQLTYRGPDFQLGLWADSQREVKELKLPPEVQGQPPFIWQLGNSTFRVLGVSLGSNERKLALDITYQPDSTNDPKQIEEQNHVLIREVMAKHADFLDGFDALAVYAKVPQGQPIHTIEKLR